MLHVPPAWYFDKIVKKTAKLNKAMRFLRGNTQENGSLLKLLSTLLSIDIAFFARAAPVIFYDLFCLCNSYRFPLLSILYNAKYKTGLA